MEGLLLLARLVLAAVFVVSGIAKLLDLAGSQSAMRSFGVPESSSKVAGIALPVVEILIAVLLYGEPFTTAHAIAFGAIWAALGLYVIAIVRHARAVVVIPE